MLRALATLLCGLGLLAVAAPLAHADFDVPDDAQRLLPAEPGAVMVIPSFRDLEVRWEELRAGLGVEAPTFFELISKLEGAGEFFAEFDPDEAWLLCFHGELFSDVDEDWGVALVMPVPQGKEPADILLDGEGPVGVRGDYAVWASEDWYEVGGKRQGELRDLPGSLIHLLVDVENLAEVHAAQLDSMREAMSAEEGGELFVRLIDEVVRSTSGLRLSVRSEGPHVDLELALRARPGSPLVASGPQPSRRDAERLARALPGSGGIVSLSAMNWDAFTEWYVGWAVELYAGLPAQAGMEPVDVDALRESLTLLYSLYSVPWAGRFTLSAGGIEAVGGFQVRDGDEFLETMETAIAQLPLPGWDIELLPVDPLPGSPEGTRSYALQLDFGGAGGTGVDGEDEAAAAMNMVSGMLSAFLPPLHFLADDDVLFFSLERSSTSQLRTMRELWQAKAGTLEPRLEAAMAWAPDADAYSVVDITPVLDLVAMFLGEIEIDPGLRERMHEAASSAMTLEKDGFVFELRFDLVGLFELFQSIKPPTGDGSEELVPVDPDGEEEWKESSRIVPGDGEVERLAQSVALEVQELRGHPFMQPVPVRVVDDAEAAEHFLARLDKFQARERLRDQQEMYRDLGIIAEDDDLEAILFEVLAEQAGGFYDPDSGTMYMLDDVPAGMASIILAHELTHALDDQIFDIDDTLASLLEDEDRQLAFTSVVEGSGTSVMSAYLMNAVRSGALGSNSLSEFQESEMARAEVMNAAPAALQRGLLAPYVLGQLFLLRGEAFRMVEGATSGDVDMAFHFPPQSMEQVIHPEKYWEEDAFDPPMEIWPELPGTLFEMGWKVSASGTLGELDVAVLTGAGVVDPTGAGAMSGEAWTNNAATGWGGDRWTLLRRGEATCTVLATVWDREIDAEQFEAALAGRGLAVSRDGDRVVVVGGDVDLPQELAAQVVKTARVLAN